MNDAELRATIALLSLKGAGPRRIRAITAGISASIAVEALLRRQRPSAAEPSISIPGAVWDGWFNQIAKKLKAVDIDAYRQPGHFFLHAGDPRWPFPDDPDPPVMLFGRGSPELLATSPAVAVVGTRRCTSVGRRVAGAMGADLAASGVAVVSGLALGVDGAAHHGALSMDGPVIGVVASGLDTVYPASHTELWLEVARRGVLVSEVPLGQRPTQWRFPARNRLIAALSNLVVVVESHRRGGALSTVDEALERGVGVAAVPGSTLSPASEGTNALLVDGAIPVRSAEDVFPHIDHDRRLETPPASAQLVLDVSAPVVTELRPQEREVLDTVVGGAVHFDRIVERLNLPPLAVADVVEALVEKGLLEQHGHVLTPGSR